MEHISAFLNKTMDRIQYERWLAEDQENQVMGYAGYDEYNDDNAS
jgi:hypothetical protein